MLKQDVAIITHLSVRLLSLFISISGCFLSSCLTSQFCLLGFVYLSSEVLNKCLSHTLTAAFIVQRALLMNCGLICCWMNPLTPEILSFTLTSLSPVEVNCIGDCVVTTLLTLQSSVKHHCCGLYIHFLFDGRCETR